MFETPNASADAPNPTRSGSSRRSTRRVRHSPQTEDHSHRGAVQTGDPHSAQGRLCMQTIDVMATTPLAAQSQELIVLLVACAGEEGNLGNVVTIPLWEKGRALVLDIAVNVKSKARESRRWTSSAPSCGSDQQRGRSLLMRSPVWAEHSSTVNTSLCSKRLSGETSNNFVAASNLQHG